MQTLGHHQLQHTVDIERSTPQARVVTPWLGSWAHQQRRAPNPPTKRGHATACAAASVAGLPSPDADGFLKTYQPGTTQQRAHSSGNYAGSQQSLQSVRAARSYWQLLHLLQECSRDQITADLLQAVLYKASQLARSAAAAAQSSANTTTRAGSSSSSSDGLAAQQLVCACLQLLLEVNEQVGGWQLSNCILSLGVLCGRGGPAAAVMGGPTYGTHPAAAAAAAGATRPPQDSTHRTTEAAAAAAAVLSSSFAQPHHQQQQQQQQAGGVLQQLLRPARSSRSDLEALLQATGPQHQLQQLLHLTRSTAIASAQPQQLVNMLYGLAVLPLRPAPDVLSLLLQGTLDQLQQMAHPAATIPHAADHSKSSSSSSRSSSTDGAGAQATPAAAAGTRSKSRQTGAGAGAAAADAYSPKQLSQLMWAAATLQIHLPRHWLSSYWTATQPVLQLYSAQDIANTCWALASLQQQQAELSGFAAHTVNPDPGTQQPPAWLSGLLSQVTAVAGGLTGQGIANTLWGLAVLQASVQPGLLQQLLQRAMLHGSSLQPQELANIVWGAARCIHLAEQQQQQQQQTLLSAAAGTGMSACRQQLQQFLSQFGPDLSAQLLPRDWSNILWAAGLAGVNPSKTLLQALWRKTPAGFSTSLNPHYPLSPTGPHSSSTAGSSSGSAAVIQAALLHPTRWSPQALANTLWGLARLRVTPPRVWLQGFEAAAVAVLPGFSEQQLANMLWALGELRQPPSDAWLLLFWQRAHAMTQQLQQAAAAAAGGGRSTQQAQQQQYWGASGAAAPEAAEPWDHVSLLLQQQHVVMVLQACGRLGLTPPQSWLQEATEGLVASAQLLLPAFAEQQQQRQEVALLHSYAAAVHSLAKLAHTAAFKGRFTSSSSSSSSGGSGCSSMDVIAVAGAAGQQLLQLMTQPSSGQLLQHLPGQDVLALLLSLTKLHLSTAAVHSIGSLLLLQALQLTDHLSSSQVAQLVVAAAEVSNYQAFGYESSGNSDSFWETLQLVQQEQQQQHFAAGSEAATRSSGKSKGSSSSNYVVMYLATRLIRHCSSMSAVDLRFSLVAAAKLQASLQHHTAIRSSSRSIDSSRRGHSSSRRRKAQSQRAAQAARHAVAAFAGAAGAAVAAMWGEFTPHQRVAAAASLAALGFSPKPHWLEALLQYSSCELSDCSNGDLVRLLQSVPVLMANRQYNQQQAHTLVPQQPKLQQQRWGSGYQQHSGMVRGPGDISQHAVLDWVGDWVAESEQRMGTFSPTQLLCIAQGLAKWSKLGYVSGSCAAVSAAGGGMPARAAAAVGNLQGSQQYPAAAAAVMSSRPWQQQQRQQQQQQPLLQLPASWERSFLAAAAARLPQTGTPELLLLLSAVRGMGAAPGQDWCAAVASEAVGRAAALTQLIALQEPANTATAVAGTGTAAGGADLSAAGAVGATAGFDLGRPAGGAVLKMHHCFWLVLELQRLGYVLSAGQQLVLLQYVAAACRVTVGSASPSAAAAATATAVQASGVEPVRPRQLWRLLLVLIAAGWAVDESWVQSVQGSAAGLRLRAWLGQRPRHGTWQQLWARLPRLS